MNLMQVAPQRLWHCQELAKEGSWSPAQMRLHRTHRTRHGTRAQASGRTEHGLPEGAGASSSLAEKWQDFGGRRVGTGGAGL